MSGRCRLSAAWGLLGLVISLAGCAPPTTFERLTGKWKGTPETQEGVDDMVEQATDGQEVHPLAKGVAKMALAKVASAVMAVNIDFKPSGAALYTGNTKAIGVRAGAGGDWFIKEDNGDEVLVQMGTGDEPFEATLRLLDNDTFEFRRAGSELPPILFTRTKSAF